MAGRLGILNLMISLSTRHRYHLYITLHINKVSAHHPNIFKLMSSQTKPSTLLILAKLHHNILWYLCDFLDAVSILNLSLTCKMSHQLINGNETYWRLRYYKEFALDEDHREGDWLKWYCRQTVPKQPTSTSQSPKTLEQKATRDWSHVNWCKAYYRRCILYNHLINGYWHERYCEPSVDPKFNLTCEMGMTPWATLLVQLLGSRMWVVRHDITPPEAESEQLAWSELPLPENIIFMGANIKDSIITNNFIFIVCTIHTNDKSDGDDQSSSEKTCEHGAIIAWDIRDISKDIPFYFLYNEVKDDTPLPRLMYSCDDWALCSRRLASNGRPDDVVEIALDSQSADSTEPASNSQPEDTSHRYSICDLKRKSYYTFGPIYTNSHAHFQSTTEDCAQVITFYLDPADMAVKHDDSAMTGDKPAGLRVHWHSYIFDDEHSTSLEDHGGEIIIPYYSNDPKISSLRYGPGLALVLIHDREPMAYDGDMEFYAVMALVRIPDYSLPQNSISRRRRIYHDRTIGEVIWMRPLYGHDVLTLYSQNLIVVEQNGGLDILSATDGKIVRRVDYPEYYHSYLLGSIIGPYCYVSGSDNLIINIETGETFEHHVKLPPSKSTTALVEDAHDSLPSDWLDRLTVRLKHWPFCNCTGRLIMNEPGHRNGFYLYSLSGF
jgi:hypothetical protein